MLIKPNNKIIFVQSFFTEPWINGLYYKEEEKCKVLYEGAVGGCYGQVLTMATIQSPAN